MTNLTSGECIPWESWLSSVCINGIQIPWLILCPRAGKRLLPPWRRDKKTVRKVDCSRTTDTCCCDMSVVPVYEVVCVWGPHNTPTATYCQCQGWNPLGCIACSIPLHLALGSNRQTALRSPHLHTVSAMGQILLGSIRGRGGGHWF